MRFRLQLGQVSHTVAWRKSFATSCTAVVLALGLAGCASQDLSKDVYLKQHRASLALSEALIAAELANSQDLDALKQGAAALRSACAALQEAGYRSSNDEPIDLSLKIAAYGTLDTCAAQANVIEDLLWRIDPMTAGHYLDHPMVSVAESDPKATIELFRKPNLSYR